MRRKATLNPNEVAAASDTSDVRGLTRAAPLSRRGFMGSSAALAAGYTIAGGPVRAEAIRTDADGLVAGMTTIKTGDGAMPAYFARPAGVDRPPIILVAMEVFGLHEHIKDVTRRLAKLGALALAPDLYFRKGDLTKIESISDLMPLVNSKPDAELFSDLDASAAYAIAQGGDGERLGIIGFCRGGRTVWLYATHNPALKAGVSFYGSLMDPPSAAMPQNAFALAGQVQAPVLGLYGAEDQGIPPDQVRQMEEKLKTAGKIAEFEIYEGAPHGFFADYRASYRKEQAEDAWKHAIAWFRTYRVLA
ncbi:dienelactone hydrolase family protein [Methylocella silvestris]|uniref:Carboxymethylenebutenolidase n=1 Tax=Methylocella silvestris TaxID=199596 RepID=A0A2J7TJK8_METSI|nr:dienelactone hydrolase family protein [Methylocella silvestris]PNG26951.1 carboxymethylenebutenolidase [Methylocella silvestris]